MPKKYKIEHKGKVLFTDHFADLPDEKCEEVRQKYYQKPTEDELDKALFNIDNGGVNTSVITNYYFKDLMAEVKLYSPRWSIAEVLESNDLIRYFYSRVIASPKVYPPSHGLIKNFETALRISGGGVAMKPSNFPMRSANMVLAKYNLNNKYYDFSCGWGTRLLSALKNRIYYFGTDPNHLLIDRLNQLTKRYYKVNSIEIPVDLRVSGSEHTQNDWIEKFGLAFSSPPYYNLEDYKVGKQSYKEGVSYQDWLSNYLKPTFENIKLYLVKSGYFAINIKNFKTYTLVEDSKQIAAEAGFVYCESLLLENRTRPSAKKDLNTDEYIMVFRI